MLTWAIVYLIKSNKECGNGYFLTLAMIMDVFIIALISDGIK